MNLVYLIQFERVHAVSRNRIAVPINRDPILARETDMAEDQDPNDEPDAPETPEAADAPESPEAPEAADAADAADAPNGTEGAGSAPVAENHGTGEAVYEIPVKVSTVLGNATVRVSDLLRLRRGTIVELDRKVGESIDIYVNNRLVARGEIIVVDERLGVTITEVIESAYT